MSENINKLFKSFIDDIINVFPEYEKRLLSYYKDAIESNQKDHPKIVEFLKNMNEISDQVINKDVTLFEDDPIILQNVSFKLIWNADISDQTKNTIWNEFPDAKFIDPLGQTNKEIERILKVFNMK